MSTSSSEASSPGFTEYDCKNIDVFLHDIQDQESPRDLMNQLPDLGNSTDPDEKQIAQEGDAISANRLDKKTIVKQEVVHTQCNLGVSEVIDDRTKHFMFAQLPLDVISDTHHNVEDEQKLDQIIDTSVAAFENQNFLNKGFLGKVSQYQHGFMVCSSYFHL